jgi:tRNA-2-methylthio-N6-dimethylallyladenosine synthase
LEGNKIKFVSVEHLKEQKNYINSIRSINADKLKKFCITTFGCQMNENDSEKLAGMLVEMGYEETDKIEDSDIIIYNTCCVRENAELKVYGHLGALKRLKEEKPDLIIAVCGCMMQQKEVVEHIREKYRHVGLVFGTHNLYRFPEMLYNAMLTEENILEIEDISGAIAEGIPISRKDGVKAWVTIMYGCDNFCSYCIVPYVRGRERSRRPDDIKNEVIELAKNGYKEITLLGQNVNSYGKDLPEQFDFAQLLKMLDEIDGIERIRFMTSHPKDLSDDLIEVMATGRKICEHLHLPVQSGSTKVLREMNRAYTKGEYLSLIKKIRSKIPNIALTTDIIVGFPGETEEDFEDTLDVVEQVKFDTGFMFLYSKRTGTPAARREDQVSESVKKARFDRLLELQNRISKEINDQLFGTEQEVLVEGLSKNSKDTFTGRTRANKIVHFHGSEDMIGKLVTVKIEKIQTWSLLGSVLKYNT